MGGESHLFKKKNGRRSKEGAFSNYQDTIMVAIVEETCSSPSNENGPFEWTLIIMIPSSLQRVVFFRRKSDYCEKERGRLF